MFEITLDQLVSVTGGQDSSTTVTYPGGSTTTSQSDFDLCVANAVKLARDQYPDTRPLGLPIPFTTDGNAAARQQAQRDNIDSMCIGPSGGGARGFR